MKYSVVFCFILTVAFVGCEDQVKSTIDAAVITKTPQGEGKGTAPAEKTVVVAQKNETTPEVEGPSVNKDQETKTTLLTEKTDPVRISRGIVPPETGAVMGAAQDAKKPDHTFETEKNAASPSQSRLRRGAVPLVNGAAMGAQESNDQSTQTEETVASPAPLRIRRGVIPRETSEEQGTGLDGRIKDQGTQTGSRLRRTPVVASGTDVVAGPTDVAPQNTAAVVQNQQLDATQNGGIGTGIVADPVVATPTEGAVITRAKRHIEHKQL